MKKPTNLPLAGLQRCGLVLLKLLTRPRWPVICAFLFLFYPLCPTTAETPGNTTASQSTPAPIDISNEFLSETSRVSGHVTTPEGEALEGARILLFMADGSHPPDSVLTQDTSKGGQGAYVLTEVPAGIYKVVVVKPGYWFSTREQKVVVTDTDISDIDFKGERYGDGHVTRELWLNLPGQEITVLTTDENYPGKPDRSGVLTSFQAPSNTGNHYGQRIHGLLLPPISGNYEFWLAGDDQCELWLSTTEFPQHMHKIANVPACTSPNEWEKHPEQYSGSIPLVAGHRYYICALMKEENGGDHLSVAWKGPTIDRVVIAGDYLTTSRSKFSFSGSIRNASGLPVPGVTVNLFEETYLESTTVTDEQGLYHFKDAPYYLSPFTIIPESRVYTFEPSVLQYHYPFEDIARADFTGRAVVETCSVSGQILHQNGKALAGLAVAAYAPDHTLIAGTVTDAEGSYVFPNLQIGQHYEVLPTDHKNVFSPAHYLFTPLCNDHHQTNFVLVEHGISFARWDHISGTRIKELTTAPSYPAHPDKQDVLTSFEAPSNTADNYGCRLYGFLSPPETGDYYFWISGDDNCELRLSKDERPDQVVLIAGHTGWNQIREWNKYDIQKSSAVPLVANRKYFVEALVKEGDSDDNLAVGWRKPSDGVGAEPAEVVPGDVLKPFIHVHEIRVEQDTAYLNMAENIHLQVNADLMPSEASDQTIFWSSDNEEIITVNNSGLVTGVFNGTAVVTVTSRDKRLSAATVVQVENAPWCEAAGVVSYQKWEQIPGNTVYALTSHAQYPESPTISTTVSSMEIPNETSDYYGARLAGYLCAPESGRYTFWIAGDDNSELWLSTNSNPANKHLIAWHTGWTDAREWLKYHTQKSTDLLLEAGRRYYIEALMKEAWGADNLAVGWRRPSDGEGLVPAGIIPGKVLSPLLSTDNQHQSQQNMPGDSSENHIHAFRLFPNPVEGLLMVQCNLPITALVVTDMTGKTVASALEKDDRLTELDLVRLRKGIYLVQILLEDGAQVTGKIFRN